MKVNAHTHTFLAALCVCLVALLLCTERPGQAVALYLFPSATQVYSAHSDSRSHDAAVSICFLLSETRVDGSETQLRGPQSLSLSVTAEGFHTSESQELISQ